MPRDYSLQVLCNVSYSSADWLPVMGGAPSLAGKSVYFSFPMSLFCPSNTWARSSASNVSRYSHPGLRTGCPFFNPSNWARAYSTASLLVLLLWLSSYFMVTPYFVYYGVRGWVLEWDIIIKIRSLFCSLLLGNLLKSRLWLRAISEHRTLRLLSAHRLCSWLLPLVLVF